MFFDNSLNDKRFRIDIRVENGYEEGCKRGADDFWGYGFFRNPFSFCEFMIGFLRSRIYLELLFFKAIDSL